MKRRDAKPLTSNDYQRLAEFRYQLRRFLVFSEAVARDAELSPQQHQALLAVKGFGDPFTIGDLAERLAIRPNSAVELVDRLVAAKLLNRVGDGADRRRVFLMLTRSAEALLEDLTAAHRDELRRLAPLLEPLIASLKN